MSWCREFTPSTLRVLVVMSSCSVEKLANLMAQSAQATRSVSNFGWVQRRASRPRNRRNSALACGCAGALVQVFMVVMPFAFFFFFIQPRTSRLGTCRSQGKPAISRWQCINAGAVSRRNAVMASERASALGNYCLQFARRCAKLRPGSQNLGLGLLKHS